MTNALVVYDSLTGNTAEVGAFIAEALGCEHKHVHKITPEDLKMKELVVLGTYVHAFAPSSEIIRIVAGLKEGQKVAFFSTYSIWGGSRAIKVLEEEARVKALIVLGSYTQRVLKPFFDVDGLRSRQFGEMLLQKLDREGW